MTANERPFPVIDVHVHVHPHAAATFLEIMDANNLSRVVNLGTLERFGFPFEQGKRAYQRVFGERMVYFTTPDFGDTATGFGERMARELERKVKALEIEVNRLVCDRVELNIPDDALL